MYGAEMRGNLLLSNDSRLVAYKVEDGRIYEPLSFIRGLEMLWGERLKSRAPIADYRAAYRGWIFQTGLNAWVYTTFLLSRVGPILEALPQHIFFQVITSGKQTGESRLTDEWERDQLSSGLMVLIDSGEGVVCGEDVYFHYDSRFVQESFYQADATGEWT
jgi:hypothetical protein